MKEPVPDEFRNRLLSGWFYLGSLKLGDAVLGFLPSYSARLLSEACQTELRRARPEVCLALQGHRGLWELQVPQEHRGLRGHLEPQGHRGLRGRHLAWQLRAGRRRIARIFPDQSR